MDLQTLASSQWGMLTSAQAVRLGIDRVQLQRMADDGRLERMGGGVYRYAAGEVTLCMLIPMTVSLRTSLYLTTLSLS